MGPWRSIRYRLEEAVRASSAESLQYVGRTWKASPSEGYPTADQLDQERIVRTALSVASSAGGRYVLGTRLHCGVARDPSERRNGERMAVETSIPEKHFTTDRRAEAAAHTPRAA